MGSNHRRLVALSMWLALFSCLAAGCQQNEPAPPVEYELQIDGGQGAIETLRVTAPAGSTVLEMMQLAQQQEQLQFDVRGHGALAFVEEINGWANDVERQWFWVYYVNDDLGGVGCGSYRLDADDTVRWVYRQSPY